MAQFFTPFDADAMPGIAEAYMLGKQRKEQSALNALQRQQSELTLGDMMRQRDEDAAIRADVAQVPQGASPFQTWGNAYAKRGRSTEAAQMYSIDDKVAELQSKGDPREYYASQQALGRMKSIGEFVKSFKGNRAALKAMWPTLAERVPEAASMNPDLFDTDGAGVLYPFMDPTTQQPIPNRFYYYDGEGKMSVMDATPKADQMELLQTRLDATAAENEKNRAAAERRLLAQLSSAERRAESKGKTATKMPPAALKLQNEEVTALGTAAGINSDLAGVKAQIESGTLNLGPLRNATSIGLNAAGLSTEGSRNYATLRATLEKLRNDSLRLNKGVQTEGDAVRAWNELMSNIRDPELVKQRIDEITQINDRAKTLREYNLSLIRQNYGAEDLDTSAIASPPRATNLKGSGNIPSAAVEYLKKNPNMKSAFDAKYGAGAAKRVLGR